MKKLLLPLLALFLSCGKLDTHLQHGKPNLFKSWSCSPVGFEDQFIVHLNLSDLSYDVENTFNESVCMFDGSNWNCSYITIKALFSKDGTGFIDIGNPTPEEISYELVSNSLLIVNVPFNSYPLDSMECK